jgi:signal transduction histidine kinase
MRGTANAIRLSSRLTTLLLTLLAWATCACVQAHPGDAQRNDGIDLAAHARWLEDTGATLSFEQVRALPASAFARGGPLRRAAYRHGAVWIRIDLPADLAAGTWWMVAGPAQMDSVRLYAPERGGRYLESELGARVAFATRPVPFRKPVFVLDLPDSAAARVLYLRMASETTTLATPRLWRPDAFAAMAARDYATWGAYFGVLGLLVLLNLYFWIDLRRALYLHCAAYLALFLALLWLLEGFGAQWPMADAPVGAAYLTRAVPLLAMGYTLWFGVELLEIRRRFPLTHAIACVVACVLASGALLLLFFRDDAVLKAMLSLRILWQPAFACLLVLQWRARPELRWIVAAFALQVAGSSVAMARNLGMLDTNGWTTHSLDVVGLVHMVVLSVALMSRLRDSERRALEMSMRAEMRLDRKVAERTAELAATNRRLETEIAERRAAQAELDTALRSERATLATQRDFVAMVSHEFRTPLSIIKAVAQRLRSHVSLGDPDLQQRLARLDRATQRMTAMIETYLADDRMRQPEVARAATPFAPGTLVSAATELHAAMDARLDVEEPSGLPGVRGDLPLLTIALSNLIDNALKYSPLEARVRLRAHVAGAHVRIDVVDRGSGVPDAERERIFQRYVRGSDGSGRPGAGLGLHLAREIARRHGGDLVLAASDAGGSTFSLLLPMAPDSTPVAALPPDPVREHGSVAHA